MFHNRSGYKKPMRDFLSSFMDEHRNPSDQFIQEERIRFQKTCDALIQHLGIRPFNPKGAISATLFDSIFTAFANNLDRIPSDVCERYARLRQDPNFEALTGKATTDTDTVINRIKLAQQTLFG